MRAIRLAAWLLPMFVAAGCGPGVGPLNVAPSNTPILFIYIVGQNSQSIFGFQVNSGDQVSPLAPAMTGTTLRPASVLVHPSKNFLYVANTGSNDVTIYTRNAVTGFITPLGIAPPTPVGTAPVALATDAKGQFLYVLNQGSGSISAFSIDSNRGSLTELPGSPFATVANPVSFVLSQTAGLIYVANGQAGTVSGFSVGADGTLTPAPGSPFAAAGTGTNLVWVAVDPKAGFVYAADSANSTIEGFSIQANGALTPISNSPFPLDGKNPAALTIDATGTFMFVGDEQTTPFSTVISGSISALRIASSGALTIMPESPIANGNTATTYLTIDPTNQFLFSTNHASGNITIWTIGANTGNLAELSGTPFAVGVTPTWVALSQ